MNTHVEPRSSISVSVSRSPDVLWSSVLASLPALLLGALRAADLDDAASLMHHHRGSNELVEESVWEHGVRSTRCGSCVFGRRFNGDSRIYIWATATCTRTRMVRHGRRPKDRPSLLCIIEKGRRPKDRPSDLVKRKGRPPKDRPCKFVSECLSSKKRVATCPPYRPGRLASETANSSASAPTSILDFSVGGAHPDEFSIMCAERPDGWPSCVDERRISRRFLNSRSQFAAVIQYWFGESPPVAA